MTCSKNQFSSIFQSGLTIYSREYWLNQKFVDTKKFPYGISRSGIFSNQQSFLLEKKGMLLRALLDEKVSNPNKADIAFLTAMRNRAFESSVEALVWSKYCDYSRHFYTLSERPKKTSLPPEIKSCEDGSPLNQSLERDSWQNELAANADYLEAG